jgi:activating signal cointegrator 1
MRCVTLHQPWATAIVRGLKTIETRSWATRHRGLLNIHAGLNDTAGWPPGAYDLLTGPGLPLLTPDQPGYGLPLGYVIGSVVLVDCVPIVRAGERPPRPGLFIEDAATTEGPRLWLCMLRPDGTVDSLSRQEDQRVWGDFRPGRWAWILQAPCQFPEPVPARGRQGVWPPSYIEAALIGDQLDTMIQGATP